jgi:hypothetical protein
MANFYNRFVFLFAGFAFLAATSAFAQAASGPWLILASGEKGAINAHTTREDLVRAYGASNVTEHDADVGEGDMEPETVLFANDPERRIEILWKDPDKKAEPTNVSIRGKKSLWHAAHGITLGTSVNELEHANGRPFGFALVNDGTDMAEQLFTWRGGLLEKEFQGNSRVILSLEWSPTKGAKPRGPADFKADSDNLAWRARNPHISAMTWVFP